MPTVELIYDAECPNVPEARTRLLRAFARAKVEARWQEWRADDPSSPPHARGHGSPTILVDGVDVAASEQPGGASCRLYRQPDGSMEGVPSVASIADAMVNLDLRSGRADSSGRGSWKLNAAMLPGIGAAFLPKVACPACWPAYAGFLSSIGLGFLIETTYLLPLTAAFLAIAVFALAFRAPRRRGYAPFGVGVVASVAVLVGKFSFESDTAMYAGLLLLVGANIWNSWPRRRAVAACPSCVVGHAPTL